MRELKNFLERANPFPNAIPFNTPNFKMISHLGAPRSKNPGYAYDQMHIYIPS